MGEVEAKNQKVKLKRFAKKYVEIYKDKVNIDVEKNTI